MERDQSGTNVNQATRSAKAEQLDHPKEWYAVIMWDKELFTILEKHESEFGLILSSKAITMLVLERLPKYCVVPKEMDWKKYALVMDVISDSVSTTSSGYHYLKVKDTKTLDNPSQAIWDMKLSPSCEKLAQEMVRDVFCGLRTTLIIWNATRDVYRGQGHEEMGMITLSPSALQDELLVVIIFHHEILDKYWHRGIERNFYDLTADYEKNIWHSDLDYVTQHVNQVVLCVTKRESVKPNRKRKLSSKKQIQFRFRFYKSEAKNLKQKVTQLEDALLLTVEELDAEKKSREDETNRLRMIINTYENAE